MRARDGAFVVDHRRQQPAMAGPPSPAPAAAKKDELRKKKAAQFQQQRAQQKTAASQAAPATASAVGGKSPTKKTARESAVPAAGASPTLPPKKASKHQLKQARERERKDKQAKNSASTASGVEAKAEVAQPALVRSRSVDELEQDGLKSRNHKMVLAPFRSAGSSHVPSWGTRQQERTVLAVQSVADRLHDEILQYTTYTKATVESMRVHIDEMIGNVRECVHSLWPDSKVETFGSYSTGIWLPSSDVDLVILDVVEVNDSKRTVKHLRELSKVLRAKPWVESIVVLETAKIPVLKLVSAESSVPIDITFESAATHSGLLARDLIKRYADEIPELYPLAIVFKQLLRERGLNDAYTGGLSSYSVVLMLIHFSQLRRNGDQCFEAAAVYASGSLPALPKPSAASATKQADTKSDSSATEATTDSVVESQAEKKVAKPVVPTVSYASMLTRPKTANETVNVANDQAKQEKETPAAAPRFSYAAVASGVVKVNKAPAVPPSYAAAVSAKPGAVPLKKPTPSVSVRPADVTAKKGLTPVDSTQCDTASVSSSTADTEESVPSVAGSVSSAVDSDDETQAATAQTQASLGEQTLMILEFFGILFDYRKNGLSVRDGGYIYRLAENRRAEIGKPALVIEDPIHPDRNVSASSFAFSKVVATFEDSFYALKYYRPSKFSPTALSCLLSSSGHTMT